MSLGSSNSPHLPRALLHSTGPSFSSWWWREGACTSPKNSSSTACHCQQGRSLTVDKDGKRPNPQAAFLQGRSPSLYISRVRARRWWEGESHTLITGR